MQSIHELYAELYKAIREMPLPTSPDDPEPAEPEEYVEPGWVAQMDEPEYNEKEEDVEPERYKDAADRFEEAYEKSREWDTLFPTYDLPKEPTYVLFEDEEAPSTK